MRVIILLIALSGTAQADYLSIQIGAGKNTNLTGASIPWDDAGGVGCSLNVRYTYPLTKRLFLGGQWFHLSQCDKGPPFNDTDESSVDHLGIFLEYRIDL